MSEVLHLSKVVSGGQSGVDRAALDVAMGCGMTVGGWCPAGRRAEDGPIDARYPLRPTPSADYAQRTAWNVRDSDGTLVLIRGTPEGGTALTIAEARRLERPLLVLDPSDVAGKERLLQWMRANGIRVLNVAGPRESEAPGIYAQARAFLQDAFRQTGVEWTREEG